MGWTGSDDPLTQVELIFPTPESAIAYAKRQGFAYVVESALDPPAEENRICRSQATALRCRRKL